MKQDVATFQCVPCRQIVMFLLGIAPAPSFLGALSILIRRIVRLLIDWIAQASQLEFYHAAAFALGFDLRHVRSAWEFVEQSLCELPSIWPR
jgi:hypothetical protein